MDIDRKHEADWPHWPSRDSRPARRDRLEQRLFRDSVREAQLEQAHAAIRRLEEAAAAEAAQIDGVERAMEIDGDQRQPVPEPGREPDGAAHLVFAWTRKGYALHKRHGDAPTPGSRLTVDGVECVVAKLVRSPLPADRRRCAYLEPT
jgi:hypothetical protein